MFIYSFFIANKINVKLKITNTFSFKPKPHSKNFSIH